MFPSSVHVAAIVTGSCSAAVFAAGSSNVTLFIFLSRVRCRLDLYSLLRNSVLSPFSGTGDSCHLSNSKLSYFTTSKDLELAGNFEFPVLREVCFCGRYFKLADKDIIEAVKDPLMDTTWRAGVEM